MRQVLHAGRAWSLSAQLVGWSTMVPGSVFHAIATHDMNRLRLAPNRVEAEAHTFFARQLRALWNWRKKFIA